MKSGSTSPVVWTERYEALRQHALNNRQSLTADPLGLVLLLRQGVASWMRCWPDASSSAPASPASPASCAASPLACLPDGQRQLTQLLAQMTSAHLSVCSAL
jgi:hypothetical protein